LASIAQWALIVTLLAGLLFKLSVNSADGYSDVVYTVIVYVFLITPLAMAAYRAFVDLFPTFDIGSITASLMLSKKTRAWMQIRKKTKRRSEVLIRQESIKFLREDIQRDFPAVHGGGGGDDDDERSNSNRRSSSLTRKLPSGSENPNSTSRRQLDAPISSRRRASSASSRKSQGTPVGPRSVFGSDVEKGNAVYHQEREASLKVVDEMTAAPVPDGPIAEDHAFDMPAVLAAASQGAAEAKPSAKQVAFVETGRF